MKKFILLTVTILSTGILSSCSKKRTDLSIAYQHGFATSAKRDLSSAD